jgi:SAM-dependent methyltransferase
MRLPDSASVYSPSVLRYAYDAWVLGISNRLAWKVPTARLRNHFETHARGTHLEAGAGTGYFPDQCRFPVARPEITLLDVNPHCLAAAAHRLARFQPKVVLADLTAPLPLRQAAFQSIHLGYLLHCLPGPMEAKGKVLENLLPHLHPTGVLFGSTLLPDGGNAFARRLTRIYNQRGIFGNAGDTMEGLEHMLAARFSRVSLERVGQAALFALRK